MNKPTNSRLLLFATVLALGALPALAQTPDGETPAQESVCDVLTTATPGLYGLCVAYCEAHDADGDDLEAQCNPSNPRLLENYKKKAGPGDPDMPCLKPACPCFDEGQLEQILNGTSVRCGTSTGTSFFKAVLSNREGEYASTDWFEKTGRAGCFYRKDRMSPGLSLTITKEEAEACQSLILEVGGSFCPSM